MATEGEALVAAGYDAVYAGFAASPTLWRIWSEHAAGRDFPAECSHISFTTLDDLRWIGAALGLDGGGALVDLACGMAGPSLWLAARHPVTLRGVDVSEIAVRIAAARAAALGLAARSEFGVGTFTRTGLPGASADAVMTLDALQYAPGKADALRECARVARPGARFAGSAFEVDPARVAGLPVLGDDPVDDYRHLLDASGFDVEVYDETPGWDARVTAAYEAIRAHAADLDREMGPEGAGALALETGLTLDHRPYRRRVRFLAVRR